MEEMIIRIGTVIAGIVLTVLATIFFTAMFPGRRDGPNPGFFEKTN